MDSILDANIDARQGVMALAEEERRTAVNKAQRRDSAYAVRRSEGRRLGGVPYGWELEDKVSGQMRRCEREALAVERMLYLRDESCFSYRAIVDDLNESHTGASRGARWHLTTVRRLLMREKASRADT